MLEILKFIFSSFWIWLGTFLMLAAAASVGLNMIRIISGKDNKQQKDYEKD